jgi:hypothetical protein
MESGKEERFTYQIVVAGPVDVDDLNAMSPLHIQKMRAEVGNRGNETTVFSVCSDQSGLIGLLRHLHARGMVLFSMQRL